MLAAAFPGLGIGFAGVALAFGLTVLTMAYALGHVSGAHFNPAISVGLWVGGRGGAGVQHRGRLRLERIRRALAGWLWPSVRSAVRGGAHTGGFLMVVMGAPDTKRVPSSFAPIAIGFALTLIHLVSIPVTNTSVNPARSTGVALYAGGWALRQLWLFWVAPLIGGGLGGLAYRALVEPASLTRPELKDRAPSRVPPAGARTGP